MDEDDEDLFHVFDNLIKQEAQKHSEIKGHEMGYENNRFHIKLLANISFHSHESFLSKLVCLKSKTDSLNIPISIVPVISFF